ncbi:MAG: hypothetical protein ACRDWV_04750, partial [Acidimicrobiales bacterium]
MQADAAPKGSDDAGRAQTADGAPTGAKKELGAGGPPVGPRYPSVGVSGVGVSGVGLSARPEARACP